MKKQYILPLIFLLTGCYPIVKFFTTDLIRGSVCDYAINLEKGTVESEFYNFISKNENLIFRKDGIIKSVGSKDSSNNFENDFYDKKRVIKTDSSEFFYLSSFTIKLIVPEDTVRVGIRVLYEDSSYKTTILSLAGYTFLGNKRTSRDEDWKTDKVVCNEFEKQVLSPFERFLQEKYPQTKIEF